MTPTATVMGCRLFLRGGMVSKGAFSGTADGAPSNTLAWQLQHDQSILLIENDPLLGTLTVECLERDGFDVVWARNGMEGYALLSRQEPAVLVLNWMLLQLDGITLLHRARQAGILCPALVLTAAQEDSGAPAALPDDMDLQIAPLQRKLEDGGKPRLLHAAPDGDCLRQRKA